MRQFFCVAAFGLAAFAAGCASQPTASAEQCAGADWYAMGEADGAAGQSMTALNDEIIACRPHGIAPDLDAYRAGRAEGLKSWCQPDVVLEAAVQGTGDPFACEPITEPVRSAFDVGRETRQAALRYHRLQQQYEQLQQRESQINQEGARLTQLYNQSTNQTERQQIAQRIDALRQELQAVEAELEKAGPMLTEEKANYETAVQTYEAYKASLN